MATLYKILCLIGIHHWIRGKGWIDLGGGNSKYHDGYRCVTCGKEKK
jgi:hypothetical protein